MYVYKEDSTGTQTNLRNLFLSHTPLSAPEMLKS